MKNKSELIGKNLQKIRETLGESKEDFSRSIELSSRMLRTYERGELPPNINVLLKIVEVYNVNPSFLLLGHGEMFLSSELTKPLLESLKDKYKIEDARLISIIQACLISEPVLEGIYNLLEEKKTHQSVLNNLSDILKLISK